MEKADIKILVVDDDEILGKGLLQALQRAGYDGRLAQTPEQAKNLVQHTDFQVLLIDCMLPKLNGVDLVQELKQHFVEIPKLILMTGVFKDKNFEKESTQTTGANAFLIKPFPVDLLIATVDDQIKNLIDEEDKSLLSLVKLSNLGASHVLSTLNENPTLHGFQLPLLFSLLGRVKFDGNVQTVSANGEVGEIVWSEGQIVEVKVKNNRSFLGGLLVEHGFTTAEEVEHVLALENNKPIGERLVENLSLSPHAIKVIREEQLVIRLSQIIQDTSVEVSISEVDISGLETYQTLPKARLEELFWDWSLSKTTQEWLETEYAPWVDTVLNLKPMKSRPAAVLMASFPSLDDVSKEIKTKPTPLQEVLDSHGEDQKILQLIHALILCGGLQFGAKSRSPESFDSKIKRYKKILKNYQDKDFFQVLGVKQQFRSKEVHRAYHDIAKGLHPDKLPAEAPQELKDLATEIFAIVSLAYSTLTDDLKLQKYRQDMERKETARSFEKEPFYQEAISELMNQRYSQALIKFERLMSEKIDFPDLISFYLWAQIKTGHGRLTMQDLYQVPPESRHSAAYLAVKGLIYKNQCNFKKAMECFQNARYLDSNLRGVQREIAATLAEVEALKQTPLEKIVDKLLGKKKSA